MWLTALLLGITGSLHCLGMCSPLVMAISNLSPAAIKNRLLYNGGRLLMYGILGSCASLFGSVLDLSHFQRNFSTALGLIFVVVGLAGIQHFKIPLLTSLTHNLLGRVKSLFSRVLAKKNQLSIPILGMLNGLLPCGLTLLALTYCVILPSVHEGFLFMLVFGIGTLPVMLGLTTVFQNIVNLHDIRTFPVARLGLLVVGLLLIVKSNSAHESNPAKIKETEIVICR